MSVLKKIVCIFVSFVLLISSIQIQSFNRVDALTVAEVKSQLFTYITQNLGYNSAVACGIMANIECECNFRPNLVEKGNGVGYGLIQWSGTRKTNLYKWCNENGYSYDSLLGQMKFLEYEIKNISNYSETRKIMESASNSAEGAGEVARIFCHNFERPTYHCKLHGQYNSSGAKVGNSGGYDYFSGYVHPVQKCDAARIGLTEDEYRKKLAMSTYWPVYGNGTITEWRTINATYGLTVNSSLPLRTECCVTSNNKITDMPAGQTVYVYEISSQPINNHYWAKVKYNGREGYCNAQYLTPNIAPDPPCVGVNAGSSFRDTTFTWSACNNAVKYEVKIDGSSKGTTTNTSYSARLYAGNHSVEVISYSSNGSSASNGAQGFTVNKTYPDAPTVSVSSGNSKTDTYVSWNKTNYGDQYKVVIYKSNGTAYASKDYSTDTSFAKILATGSYYAVVTAKNNTDNTTTDSSKISFNVEAAVPTTPQVNVLPGNNYTDTTITWNSCTYADDYRLEITNSDTNQKILNKTLTDTSYTQIFSTAGNYIAKVYANNTQDNVSTPSTEYKFYVESADCTEFELSVRGRSDSVIVLNWTVSEHATQYDVYRYEDGKYVLIGTTSETEYTDANLYVDTEYQYYVKASNQWTEMDSNEIKADTIILTINGSGLENDPYIISSVDDFVDVANLVNDSTTTKVFADACYQLTSDIDLSGATVLSIGTENCPFNGTFNGNYYTITNATTGLFGYCNDATIENIIVYGTVSSTADNVGGIAGTLGANGIIENSAFYGNVTGGNNTGGIVGMANGSKLIRCYQIGQVTGKNGVGGIIGQATDGMSATASYHAGGTVSGTGKSGGFTGYENISNTATSYTDCYYLSSNASSGVSGGANAGVVAVNATVLKNLADTFGEPFTTNTDTTVNSGYPVFSWETSRYEFSGQGTSSSPYQIKTAEDLEYLSQYVSDKYLSVKYGNAHYIQTADIDLTGITWTPIGTSDIPFNGTYNGGYRSITGLSNNTKLSYGGLFGYCGTAKVENLVVYGSISSTGSTGGIVAESTGKITLEEVAFIGTVKGTNAGGLVGKVNVNGKIDKCYHNGAITGTNAGGIVGCVIGDSNVATDTCFITNSYHTNGTISGTTSAGIVGSSSGTTVDNCFYLNGSTSNTSNGTAANATVMKQLSDTIGNPFEENTDTSVNNGYPIFSWQGSRYEFEGTGTETDPYIIASAEDLMAMRDYINNPAYYSQYASACYEQLCDIDLSDIEWTPIGMSEEYAFKGTYNGNYFSVYGLNANGETYSGLFGQIGATTSTRTAGVYNVLIEYGTSGSKTGTVGGVAAVLMNGATIDSCAVIGDLYGENGVGGIVGIVQKSATITNSYHNGNVSGTERVGGILGCAESGTARIENCYHTVGTVSGIIHTGAIVGYVSGTTKISNCYYLTGTNSGAVDGKTNTGVSVETSTNLMNMADNLGDAYSENVFEVYYNDGYPILSALVPEPTEYIDINLDGEFTTDDIAFLQQYILKGITFTQENFVAADMNGDGNVDAMDLALVKQIYMS